MGDTNAVGRELKMMEGLCPKFIPTLAAYGVASERGIYTLPGPGSAFDAKSAMNVQVRADLMGMGVVA